MRKIKSFILLALLMVFLCGFSKYHIAMAAEEQVTAAVSPSAVTVTNNYMINDTVKVTGLVTQSVVKVYKNSTITSPMGIATVATGLSEATVRLSQIGEESGSIFVTVTEKGKSESERTEISYNAEATSKAPEAANITVTNNATGRPDMIKVTGLAAKDVVKVYNLDTNGVQLGTAIVAIGKTDISITVSQVGVGAGSIYVSVTSVGKKESSRIQKSFIAEEKTASISGSAITVTNNYKIVDTIKVTGLKTGDIVKVYKDKVTTIVLGSATVTSGKSEATVNIAQIGATAGNIYVSVTSTGKNASDRTEVSFEDEKTTDKLVVSNITITNNATGKSDIVKVTNLKSSDVVKVYSQQTEGVLKGTATVPTGKTEVNVNVLQVGAEAGSVFVSITNVGKKESDRVEKTFAAEVKSESVSGAAITVSNNYKIADTVTITGLKSGDIVKVYKDNNTAIILGSARVTAGKTEAKVYIAQLGATAGKIYVSITSDGKNPSDREEISYDDEKVSAQLVADNITVTNNPTGKSDLVKITNLKPTDVVKVYRQQSGTGLIGTASVPSGRSEVNVNVTQIGAAAGSIYVSVTSVGKKESVCVEKTFDAEVKTVSVSGASITITNNYRIADTVKVTGLKSGDVVKVYKDDHSTALYGSAKVATGKTEAIVSVSQLGATAGKIYVSVTTADKNPSDRVEVSFEDEKTTDKPQASDIAVINNITGKADVVTVSGLVPGDIVKVYNQISSGVLLGTASVSIGQDEVSVRVSQVGANAGSVFVTVINMGKKESERVEKNFEAEVQSTSVSGSAVTVTNNLTGKPDTIRVTGLKTGSTVKIYKDATTSTLLGKAIVYSGNSEVTISITQIGSSGGTIYISVIEPDKNESVRTPIAFNAEQQG